MKERTEGYSYGGGYGRQSYGGSGSGYGGSQGYGGYGQGFGDFWQQAGWQQQTSGYDEEPRLRAAGNYLRNGYYREARNTLDGMGEHEKTARWYYYSAIANSGIGNNVIALQHAREAARMEPNNIQYTTLVQRLENGGNWYRQQQEPYQTTFSSSGDWCVKLCIANLVCNLCCGGSGLC